MVKPLFLWLVWFFHPFLGKQHLRYGCRRKVDSKMVHKRFCNKSNMKPRGGMRDCNQKACPPPMYVFTWEAQHLWKYDLQWESTLGLKQLFLHSGRPLFSFVVDMFWWPSTLFPVFAVIYSPAGWRGSGRTAASHVERRACKSDRWAASNLRMTTKRVLFTTNTATTTVQSRADPATDFPAPPSGELDSGHRYVG